MCVSGPKVEVPTPPPIQAAPQEQDAIVTNSREEELRRRRAAAGRKSTILTGSQGTTGTALTSGKTLLGQ
ncbi:hypothetical protein QE177_09025 [Arsenophonus sp. aPb]|uniref:Uncharacterized protein n=1 Tax=Arsenophonus nasoniae TaxID=638 RepID=A0AA95GD04_9GAMM|nr:MULTISPECIES: hypothetical protein [Arsenophonus]WGL96477.1 hypothetical protein QE207_08040 [Arsenophonus nasoniae]WGL97364.1 hypothetical protein QE177_09025 [Arsenophonus sp. aPb]